MSGMYPVDGSKIFIGGKINIGKDDLTAASFVSQVWTEIDGWVNAGAIGDTQEVITQGVLNRGRVVKLKGSKDAGTSDQQFLIIGNDPGQKLLLAAQENQCDNFAFRIQWGADCSPESVVTFTAAPDTDTVVNWVGHGLSAGQAVIFTNSGGAFPTGIDGGEVYYVLTDGLTADSFKFSLNEGGTAFQATTVGTGTNTATAANARGTSMFAGLVTSNQRQGGGTNTVQLQTFTLAISSNIVDV